MVKLQNDWVTKLLQKIYTKAHKPATMYRYNN